jgi:hypothetical protein
MQGETKYFGEEELKDTVKSVGVMTGWKFKDSGEGKFDAKVSGLAFILFFGTVLEIWTEILLTWFYCWWNLPIRTASFLSLEFEELAGVHNLCGTGA